MDVIHDFWVPAFRMKIDAVPGITTNYRVTPNRLGNYPVVCAELCGLGHAYMRQTAHVLAQRGLRRVGAARLAVGQQAGGGGAAAAVRRRRRRRGRRQGALHAGQRADRRDGLRRLPHAGRRGHERRRPGRTSTSRWRARTPPTSSSAIVEPNAEIAQGFGEGIMPPNYGETLSPEQVEALVDYLGRVTK